MTDYISREALVKTTRETPFTMSMCLSAEECRGMNRARNILADIFEILPAADVRPVVLCRDCKYNLANIPDEHDGININEGWNACWLTELYDNVKPDDFCSYGEKRGES